MPRPFDVIVLGCGAMGAAVARTLADRGQRVLAMDRYSPPHSMGSHHGDVRMFRMSYFENPAYVPWLRRSLAAWLDLGVRWGRPLLHLTGALYLGLPESELISGCRRAIDLHGLEHERLSAAQVRARFPAFDIPATFVGLFERDAGHIECEEAIRAMIDSRPPGQTGAGGGLELRGDEPALEWEAGAGWARVRTHTGVYEARALVITAGAWAPMLLKELGASLTVTRQVQGWVRPTDAAAFSGDLLPCWAVDTGGGSLFYGFPALQTAHGFEVKVARHARGEPAPDNDPQRVDRAARPNDADDFMPEVRRFLPGLADASVRTSVCLYTSSPDGHFLIDRHPGHSNVAIACGFSGHGFKLAPAVGEILAGLVDDRRGPHPEPFFSLDRLRLTGPEETVR